MKNFSTKKEIEQNIISLQDKVSRALEIEKDVDKFLDETSLFDEWEKVIPDAEYGIFVIAVLNNIRNKTIINTIIDSILNIDKAPNIKIKNHKREIDQHPFS